MAKSNEQVIEEFNGLVNMRPKELEEWLSTEESKSVGHSDDGEESKGHKSGRKIVEIERKNKSDYTEEDVQHMQNVTNYIKRHRAQPPGQNAESSRWRYSLMNWGHDPLKN